MDLLKIFLTLQPKSWFPTINSIFIFNVAARSSTWLFKVSLIDGAYHDVDSSVLAFEIAGRAALRDGLRKAGAKLLEPVMKVEVVTPEDYTGSIIGDLTSRRGMVTGQETRGNAIVVNAFVPLANMFGYINNLRSMSSGRAQFTMIFDHYEQVPQAVAEEVKAKLA